MIYQKSEQFCEDSFLIWTTGQWPEQNITTNIARELGL